MLMKLLLNLFMKIVVYMTNVMSIFKNIKKKKDLWQKLSENLRNCYTVNMSSNFLFF